MKTFQQPIEWSSIVKNVYAFVRVYAVVVVVKNSGDMRCSSKSRQKSINIQEIPGRFSFDADHAAPRMKGRKDHLFALGRL